GGDPSQRAEQERARQLEQKSAASKTFHELEIRLGKDLLAGRRTLTEAVEILAETDYAKDPRRLRWRRQVYPGCSLKACLAAGLIQGTLESLDGMVGRGSGKVAQKLAADLQLAYGIPLPSREPTLSGLHDRLAGQG